MYTFKKNQLTALLPFKACQTVRQKIERELKKIWHGLQCVICFFYSKNDLLNVNLPSVISGMSESKNSWQLQKRARSSGDQQVPGSSLVVFFTQWRIQVLNEHFKFTFWPV